MDPEVAWWEAFTSASDIPGPYLEALTQQTLVIGPFISNQPYVPWPLLMIRMMISIGDLDGDEIDNLIECWLTVTLRGDSDWQLMTLVNDFGWWLRLVDDFGFLMTHCLWMVDDFGWLMSHNFDWLMGLDWWPACCLHADLIASSLYCCFHVIIWLMTWLHADFVVDLKWMTRFCDDESLIDELLMLI